jgi:hypothetical protein
MGDIGTILELVRRVYPDVVCEQLQVVHPGADDEGLWFFTRPGISNEVQIESPPGTCPFARAMNVDATGGRPRTFKS